MKINNDTDFHWRNYLKPTPPLIFWVITTSEAVVLTVNSTEILQRAKPGMILTLLILQTIIGKLVLFFGRIKDEYESKQKITITTTGDMEVKKETIDATTETNKSDE